PVYSPAFDGPPAGAKGGLDAAWKAHKRDHPDRCRDCGSTSALNQGGSVSPVGATLMLVCDPCAALDGARIVEHHARRCDPRPDTSLPHWTIAADCANCTWTVWDERFVEDGEPMQVEPTPADVIDAQIALHRQPRWVSLWGATHPLEQHDQLVAAQARRRDAYLKKTSPKAAAAA
ncbi:MAG: hypothetical protein ACTH31_13255, partial [Pseudoclavibacter sp.]